MKEENTAIECQMEYILKKLKEKGCRITEQRKLLIRIILEEKTFSTKEIYYKASRLDKSIGIATVYRMLNLLEEMELLKRRSVCEVLCNPDMVNAQ